MIGLTPKTSKRRTRSKFAFSSCSFRLIRMFEVYRIFDRKPRSSSGFDDTRSTRHLQAALDHLPDCQDSSESRYGFVHPNLMQCMQRRSHETRRSRALYRNPIGFECLFRNVRCFAAKINPAPPSLSRDGTDWSSDFGKRVGPEGAGKTLRSGQIEARISRRWREDL